MKEKVRISSLITNTVLYGKTLIDGQWQILTEDYQQMSLYEFENNVEHKGKKMFTFNYSESSRDLIYEYYTTEKPLLPKPELSSLKTPADHDRFAEIVSKNLRTEEENLLNRRKRLATMNFFGRHMQISQKTSLNNGHFTTSQPIAEMEIVTQVAKNNYLGDLKVAKAFIKIATMDWRKQYDAAIYYHPPVFGMRRSEVLNKFIGLKGRGTKEFYLGGVLWQNKNLDDFLQNYDNNPTVVMKIYISKAIQAKILAHTKDGIYMNQSTFVGRTLDQAVVYFSGDLQSYTNYIQPKVDEVCGLPEDDLLEETVVPTLSNFEKKDLAANKQQDWKEERRNQITLAESLGIKNPADYKQADLQVLVDAAKAKLNAVAQHEALPTVILEQEVDDLLTEDVDKLKEIGAAEGINGLGQYKDIEKIRARIRSHRAAMVD